MKRLSFVLVCMVWGGLAVAAEGPGSKTVIEVSQSKRPATGGLGTTGDVPTEKERPFREGDGGGGQSLGGIEVPLAAEGGKAGSESGGGGEEAPRAGHGGGEGVHAGGAVRGMVRDRSQGDAG